MAEPRAPSPRACAAVTPFDGQTPLAEVAAADPGAAARLAALHPSFSATGGAGGQATIAEAAAAAGVPLDDALTVVNARLDPAAEPEPRPPWMDGFADEPSRLDVRPILASGRDPFGEIMALVAALGPGGGLVIEAPFDPVPLRRVLAARDFTTWAERLAPGHWRLWCRAGEAGGGAEPARRDGLGARIWRADDGTHIDVRGLEAPRPLVAVLGLVDSEDHASVVVLHHERTPVYLFPELFERGWSAEEVPGEPGERRWLLRKADDR